MSLKARLRGRHRPDVEFVPPLGCLTLPLLPSRKDEGSWNLELKVFRGDLAQRCRVRCTPHFPFQHPKKSPPGGWHQSLSTWTFGK